MLGINKKMSEIIIRQLNPEHFPLAKKFYKQFGQPTKTNRNDLIYAAFSKSIMQACLRIAPCGDSRLLRGVFVAPNCRKAGLGRGLIAHALAHCELDEVWTFPYEHLHTLYKELNFEPVTAENAAPPIREAFEAYTKQGKNISLMRWKHL